MVHEHVPIKAYEAYEKDTSTVESSLNKTILDKFVKSSCRSTKQSKSSTNKRSRNIAIKKQTKKQTKYSMRHIEKLKKRFNIKTTNSLGSLRLHYDGKNDWRDKNTRSVVYWQIVDIGRKQYRFTLVCCMRAVMGSIVETLRKEYGQGVTLDNIRQFIDKGSAKTNRIVNMYPGKLWRKKGISSRWVKEE